MFGQRFDPLAFERKRRAEDEVDESESHSSLSSDDTSESETSSSDSDSESVSGSDNAVRDEMSLAANDAMDVDPQTEQGVSGTDSTNETGEVIQNNENSKHSAVLSKFKKSVQTEGARTEMVEEEVEMQDLTPMPQPVLPRDQRLKITVSNHLDWLATPVYVSPSQTQPFEEFGLSKNMLKNLKANNFVDAFSVQLSVVKTMLEDAKQNNLKPDSNGDILVNASTGSGKTLAYTIPIIEALSKRVVPRVRAIVLVPTKPLVNQVKQTFLQLSAGTNLYVMNLRPDLSIKEESNKLLSNTPDIIVSTPGRLVEHIVNGSIDLSAVRYVVIDEADRLLNQSFQNWSGVLMKALRREGGIDSFKIPVQKLVFSATLTTDAGKLSLLDLYQPRLVVVNDKEKLVNEMFSTPATLKEYIIKAGSNKGVLKPILLARFLMTKTDHILVFTKSNEASIRLCRLLSILIPKLGGNGKIEYLNSTNNSTSIRNKILQRFSNGDISVLVVTDLIARGIDIANITDVINYDMPNSSREYVHRVGRTARANQDGNSYSFVFGKGEMKWFKGMMKDVSREAEIEEIDPDIYREDSQLLEEVLSQMRNQDT